MHIRFWIIIPINRYVDIYVFKYIYICTAVTMFVPCLLFSYFPTVSPGMADKGARIHRRDTLGGNTRWQRKRILRFWHGGNC